MEDCDCETLQPCPRCGEQICLNCENWQRHHSLLGWVERNWWYYIGQRFAGSDGITWWERRRYARRWRKGAGAKRL